ncbi:MAG: transposase [Balneolales bacterium]
MEITKLQLKTLIGNHIKRDNGLHEVMEMMLNAMMKSERSVELERMSENKANGYRYGKTYGQGRILELRIPRDRNGEFYPKVLALLRSQQAEIDQMVSALYSQGFTQRQIARVFEDLYGRSYSPSTISRMIEWMREDVGRWLERRLEGYYPVIFIDAIQIKVRRQSVANEAFYVVMGVTPERKREVLAVVHFPSESVPVGRWCWRSCENEV